MDTNLTVDEIYTILEQEMVMLKIKPGELISENQICKRFQVSRTPIRSVLQRLQQNGFVQIIPHKGTRVTVICIDIVNQWIYQRVAVECMVLRDFMKICTPTDVARMHYVHQQLTELGKNCYEPDFDINEFLDMDLSMHGIMFQVTGKPQLWENLTKPHADYSRFIRLDVVGGRNVPDVLREHQEILDIIETQRQEAIEPLLKRHLYGGIRRIGGQLFSPEYQDYFQAQD